MKQYFTETPVRVHDEDGIELVNAVVPGFATYEDCGDGFGIERIEFFEPITVRDGGTICMAIRSTSR